ncbi:MAG: DNA internalization-related competence protein ComEC/Rec2 [Fluviibacter sp.]
MSATLIAFALGILGCQFLPEIPDGPWGWLTLGTVLLLGLLLTLRSRTPQPIRLRIFLILLAFSAGASYTCWRSSQLLSDTLPEAAMGRNIRITGVVDSLPDRTARGQRFQFLVEHVDSQFHVPERLQLSVWHTQQDTETAPDQSLREVKAGERWALTVRLKRPHGLANPHGYDIEARLFESGIRATGYVKAGERLDAFVPGIATTIAVLRSRIRERFERVLPAEAFPDAGILTALAIGDQKAIPGSLWQVFAKTGTTHLMSISGLHVTLFSGLVALLVSFIWRRNPRWVARLPAQKMGVFCGWFAAAFYTLIAGAGVPALRTLFMLTVGAIAVLTGRHVSPFRILLVALVAVLLLDPWAGMSPGFWLSFVAVGLLLWAALSEHVSSPEQRSLKQRLQHWLKTFGRTQWAVTIGTLPLLLLFFSQFSLVSPLTNAIAIPWVSAVVTPLTILALVIPWDGLLYLANALMTPLLAFLSWSAALPLAIWHAPVPSPLVFVLACLGALWWLLPAGLPGRGLAIFLCLPLVFAQGERIPEGQARIDVLDVGQGLAVVVRTHQHVLLYDTGPYYSSVADAGVRVIVPYLRAMGVDRLDGMVVTHRDTDHSGGAQSVLESMPVGWVADAPDTRFADFVPGVHSKNCAAGRTWTWDGVQFEFIHPASKTAARDQASNHQSCVLQVSVGGKSMLLTSDIELVDEQQMVSSGLNPSQVLLVPHHGSGTSSSTALLDAVQPEVAIVPVGYRNRYRHPKPSVIDAYEARRIKLYRTDTDGMVQVDLPSLKISAYRRSHQRYWMDQPTSVSAQDEQ